MKPNEIAVVRESYTKSETNPGRDVVRYDVHYVLPQKGQDPDELAEQHAREAVANGSRYAYVVRVIKVVRMAPVVETVDGKST